jgi:hypothetical protein
MTVASPAAKRQILQNCRASVLNCPDVIDWETQSADRLRHATVLAGEASPLTDGISQLPADHCASPAGLFLSERSAFSRRIASRLST